jgi:glutathione S-transferase
MLTVHHLNQSRSKRILWLLEELAMPYNIVTHQRDTQTHLAPASLHAIHPLGKSPVIVDGDTVLAESGAIIEYILRKDAKHSLKPAAFEPSYADYLQWLHFAEGSLALPLMCKMLMSFETRDGKQAMDGYIAKEIAVDFDYIENTLQSQDFFAGDAFSAADIMMTISLEFAAANALLEGRINTLAYLSKMQSRAAYQRAAQQ